MLQRSGTSFADSALRNAADQHGVSALPERLVPQLVAEVARDRPNAIALRAGGASLTYSQFNADANRLARHLVAEGVGPEVLVAVCLPRSVAQIEALLAIQKAGGAFLPLDPAWPEGRIRSVLAESGASIVISDRDRVGKVEGQARRVIRLDEEADTIAARDATDLPARARPENLAYVIYTSGSTGVPKGAEITHANLVNLARCCRDWFGLTAEDVASHLAGLAFDAAVFETWPLLSVGATLVLVEEMVRSAPDRLHDWLLEERITYAFLPTSLAQPMLSATWPTDARLRMVVAAGEALHAYPRPDLPFVLINGYGPTECTVGAAFAVIAPTANPDGPPPIGHPFGGSTIHLLDPNGHPVPAGAIGEICIGGPIVGRGYRKRPDLTAERFVLDRFSGVADATLYRTGDLGSWRADGQLMFRGRIDDQVKIRGNRVEPDEVASVLNRHPAVAASAVVARESATRELQLVAYVMLRSPASFSEWELSRHLRASLPDYMVPTAFVRLDRLPLNLNGKLDKNALPEANPANRLDITPYREPSDPTERYVADLWGNVLRLERVGADDNFFSLGGQSLFATQIVLRAGEAFGLDLDMRHLFEAPTVAEFAARIVDLVSAEVEALTDEEVHRAQAGEAEGRS